MVRTGQAAIDYARSRIGPDQVPAGYCLAVTREFYAIGSYYGSAIDAWNGAQWRHENSSPPPATPVFFASASVYDHVAFYVSHDEVITVWNEDIRAMTWNDMLASFGPRYGWTEDLNTVRVYTPGTDPGGEDDMPSAEEVAKAVWEYPIVGQGVGVGYGPGPAYTWLRDARNAAAGVWDYPIHYEGVGVGYGPGPASSWLGDARNAAKIAADAGPATQAAVSWQTVLALVLAVAVVIGLVFALLFSVREGVASGAAVLLGGIVGWIATTLRLGSRGRHV
jgi:hypothetical protein